MTSLRQALAGGVALAALSMSIARAQETEISVPAQSLAQTLKDISQRTGENILFRPESVSGLGAPALNGKMSAQDALARALAGSGLEAAPDGSGGFIIRRVRPKNVLAASDEEAAQSGLSAADGAPRPRLELKPRPRI